MTRHRGAFTRRATPSPRSHPPATKPSDDIPPWAAPWAAWRRADIRLDCLEALTRHRLATGQPLVRGVRRGAD